MTIQTPDHIYGELRKRGYSVRRWADEQGYRPRTVQDCIHTYAPCKNKVPSKDSLSLKIMERISLTIGVDLIGEQA